MNMQEYLKNRLTFPITELDKYRGEWVAWSPDGTRVVAASRDPESLEESAALPKSRQLQPARLS